MQNALYSRINNCYNFKNGGGSGFMVEGRMGEPSEPEYFSHDHAHFYCPSFYCPHPYYLGRYNNYYIHTHSINSCASSNEHFTHGSSSA